jgi:hypothetical protein
MTRRCACGGWLVTALLATFLAACVEPTPPTSLPPAEESSSAGESDGVELARCENPQARPPYRLDYPADWFVHPSDPEADVPPCTYFGPVEFQYVAPTSAEDTVESIVVRVFTGCVVEEQPPLNSASEVVDGFPATATEFTHGGAARRYNWKVELHRGLDCVTDTTGFVQTATWMPGNYATNKEVLNLIVRSMDFLIGD